MVFIDTESGSIVDATDRPGRSWREIEGRGALFRRRRHGVWQAAHAFLPDAPRWAAQGWERVRFHEALPAGPPHEGAQSGLRFCFAPAGPRDRVPADDGPFIWVVLPDEVGRDTAALRPGAQWIFPLARIEAGLSPGEVLARLLPARIAPEGVVLERATWTLTGPPVSPEDARILRKLRAPLALAEKLSADLASAALAEHAALLLLAESTRVPPHREPPGARSLPSAAPAVAGEGGASSTLIGDPARASLIGDPPRRPRGERRVTDGRGAPGSGVQQRARPGPLDGARAKAWEKRSSALPKRDRPSAGGDRPAGVAGAKPWEKRPSALSRRDRPFEGDRPAGARSAKAWEKRSSAPPKRDRPSAGGNRPAGVAGAKPWEKRPSALSRRDRPFEGDRPAGATSAKAWEKRSSALPKRERTSGGGPPAGAASAKPWQKRPGARAGAPGKPDPAQPAGKRRRERSSR